MRVSPGVSGFVVRLTAASIDLLRGRCSAAWMVEPNPGYPLHTPRTTTALTQLCDVLTDAAAVYPGTDLQIHYSVKPHR